tara:strand:+ start:660 stop:818 length:159 start_codon:yes stop_codon:yes gene_type:complete
VARVLLRLTRRLCGKLDADMDDSCNGGNSEQQEEKERDWPWYRYQTEEEDNG